MNINGFQAKLYKLISGNFLPNTLELNLALNFEIDEDQGELSFNLKIINFDKNEQFFVKLNGVIHSNNMNKSRKIRQFW